MKKSLFLGALMASALPIFSAHAQFDFLQDQMRMLSNEANQMLTNEATKEFEKDKNLQQIRSELEAFNQEKASNELQIKIYEGVSPHKGKDGQIKSCMVGMAFEKDSKKIRNFKAVSNLDFGVVDSALIRSMVKLANDKFHVGADAQIAQEQLIERTNKYTYVSLNVIPMSDESETELKKLLSEQKFTLDLEKMGSVSAGIYMDYKLESKLLSLSRKNKVLRFEQGLQAGFIKYSLVDIDAEYDLKAERFKNFKAKAGVGFGINANVGCSELREI